MGPSFGSLCGGCRLAFRCAVRCPAYLDLLGPESLRLRQLQSYHAVLIRRVRLVGVDAIRQPQRALEGAVADLAPVEVALLVFLLLAVFRLDGQNAVGDRDVDFLGPNTRQERLHFDAVARLRDLNRKPGLVLEGARSNPPRPRKAVVEQPVHRATKLSERVPPCNACHLCSSTCCFLGLVALETSYE